MRRLPIGSTVVVTLAVATMIALGVWQLQRREWKEGLLAQYAANLGKPTIALPDRPTEAVLFRTATSDCRPTGWASEAGRTRAGGMGWRQIATCAGGFAVQIGVARDPGYKPGWHGGAVTGYVTHAPDHRALIAAAFDHAPQPLMIVAAQPIAGLDANPSPDLSSVPNNHLAYAVQWFVFAGIAGAIYALALRSRWRAREAGTGR